MIDHRQSATRSTSPHASRELSPPEGREKAGHADLRVRSEYLIDRFRVEFEAGTRWLCACAEFAAWDACCHTREAAGRRAAQAQIAERLAQGRSYFRSHGGGRLAARAGCAPPGSQPA